MRPDGWTSADAAGLPILPGLARYDEVAAGSIDHALRFTVQGTRDAHEALKRYGMMVADNGSSWYVSGAPDPRWSNDDLHTLGRVEGSDFEVVDPASIHP